MLVRCCVHGEVVLVNYDVELVPLSVRRGVFPAMLLRVLDRGFDIPSCSVFYGDHSVAVPTIPPREYYFRLRLFCALSVSYWFYPWCTFTPYLQGWYLSYGSYKTNTAYK